MKPQKIQKNRGIMKNILILQALVWFFCGIAFADNSSEAVPNGATPQNASMQQNASEIAPDDSNLPSWIYPAYPPYTSADKVDPFVSFVKVREYETMQAARKAKTEKKALSPLENLDSNALKVVAIMSKEGSNVAMVELPDGKGYLIRPGMAVGLYDGVVTSIEKDMIVVEEEVVDVFGEAKKRKINLRLRQEKE